MRRRKRLRRRFEWVVVVSLWDGKGDGGGKDRACKSKVFILVEGGSLHMNENK